MTSRAPVALDALRGACSAASHRLSSSWSHVRAVLEQTPALHQLLLLLGIATSVRLAAVLAWHVDPIWDAVFYHTGASSLAEGHGYTTPDGVGPRSHYPVGYSALLAPLYWAFDGGPLIAPLFNAGIGVATTWLVWDFGRRALGPSRGFVAALLMALHPGLILYCNLTMTEPLAGFLLLLTGWLLHDSTSTSTESARSTRPCAVRPWLAGICLGIAVLVRPQSLLAIVVLLWALRGGLRQRIWTTLRVALACGLVVAPWTARNCSELDGCALVSTNGGWNLAISAITEDGGYRELPPNSDCREAQGPVEQDRCFRDRGLQRIAADPLAWLAKIPDKLRHTYNYEAFAIGYLAHADPETWPDQRAWAWINRLGAFHHLLMCLAALSVIGLPPPAPANPKPGLGAGLRRLPKSQRAVLMVGVLWLLAALFLPEKPVFWLIVVAPIVALLPLRGAPPQLPRYWWGLMLLTSLTHAVFFGSDRYHLVVSPVICLLAAAALRRVSPPEHGSQLPVRDSGRQRPRDAAPSGLQTSRSTAS